MPRRRSAEAASAGDLIFYRGDKILKHAGVIRDVGIESKWGLEGSIYRHSTLAVPKKYGSELRFFHSPDVETILYELRNRAANAQNSPP
ncbi:MAG TPA: hypothetical protein VK714_12580 [Myxococcota bacterium]|nr:hypothetical protein [Myxococcota bacterium]